MISYCDLSILDVSEGCFRDIAGESLEDLRINSEGTRVIIKWGGKTPSWLANLSPVIRNHKQAKEYYVKQNGWS